MLVLRGGRSSQAAISTEHSQVSLQTGQVQNLFALNSDFLFPVRAVLPYNLGELNEIFLVCIKDMPHAE